MGIKQGWPYWLASWLVLGFLPSVYADTISDPCGGPSALLNLIDRPSNADSACVVPFKNALLETGYAYQKLSHTGYQQNFPQAEFRVGLPAHNEMTVLLPNYIHQSFSPHAGVTATTVGVKHEMGYNAHWLGTVEALFTLPSGSTAFGSNALGTAVNGIVSYTVNPQINLTFELGGSTQTASSLTGGQRYTTVNPDMVFTYSATDNWDLYWEVYGQSRTGPQQGSGFNTDAGMIYLWLPNVALDLEAGQRLSGNLQGFQHYVGTGLSVMM